MKKFKRTFTGLLCIVMVVVFMPAMTFAESVESDFSKGGKLTLTSDITVTNTIKLDKNTVIDLGGHTITYAGKSGTPLFDINIPLDERLTLGEVTISNGKLASIDGGGIKVSCGKVTLAKVHYTGAERGLDVIGGIAMVDENSTLTTTGSDVACYIESMQPFSRYIASALHVYGRISQSAKVNGNYAITGNPKDGSSEASIYIDDNALIESASSVGIYYPQMGNMVVRGAVTGTTAIEVAGGDQVEIYHSAVLKATAPKYTYNPDAKGAHSSGAALALVPNIYSGGYSGLYVHGGNFYGPAAFVTDGFKEEIPCPVVGITGGYFEGEVAAKSKGGIIEVSQGIFTNLNPRFVEIKEADSIIARDEKEGFTIYGDSYIDFFLNEISLEKPDITGQMVIEITSVKRKSSYIVPDGVLVKNKSNAAVLVNGDKLASGESLQVGPPTAADKSKQRLAGADRFKTAIATADAMKKESKRTSFDTIVVADGLGYADALSGTYLATAFDAPILTVGKDKASQQLVEKYIAKNLTEGGQVYILGGKNAVNSDFEARLNKHNLKIKRLGGLDRYDTNLLILKEIGFRSSEVIVCSGTGFADSLSASATGKPILLVGKSLNESQKSYLSKIHYMHYCVIGGEKAVNAAVEEQLRLYGSTERVTGANRFETSVAVAKRFFDDKIKNAVLAYAMNFPDGLSGGPFAYTMNGPLLLVTSNNTSFAEEYFRHVCGSNIFVIGGEKLISDDAANRILN